MIITDINKCLVNTRLKIQHTDEVKVGINPVQLVSYPVDGKINWIRKKMFVPWLTSIVMAAKSEEEHWLEVYTPQSIDWEIMIIQLNSDSSKLNASFKILVQLAIIP